MRPRRVCHSMLHALSTDPPCVPTRQLAVGPHSDARPANTAPRRTPATADVAGDAPRLVTASEPGGRHRALEVRRPVPPCAVRSGAVSSGGVWRGDAEAGSQKPATPRWPTRHPLQRSRPAFSAAASPAPALGATVKSISDFNSANPGAVTAASAAALTVVAAKKVGGGEAGADIAGRP